MKTVLTIAGSDSSGGAGIQADLKTFTAFGVFGMSVITALTAQNTLGVQGIYDIPEGFIKKQLDSIFTDMGASAVKIGMLSSIKTIHTVAEKMREYEVRNIILDPVMVAKSGDLLLEKNAVDALTVELFPLALIVTPNLPEAKVLTGIEVTDVTTMETAAEHILRLGPQNVLIKGGHLSGKAVDVFFDGKKFTRFESAHIETQNTHGTGCTLSSAIAAGIALGKPLIEAVSNAKEYITEAIRYSLSIGKGYGPLNHMYKFSHFFEEN